MDQKDIIKYNRAIERLDMAESIIAHVDEIVDGTIPMFSPKQKEWEEMLNNLDSISHFIVLTKTRLNNLMRD
jgi:hypothetical protein